MSQPNRQPRIIMIKVSVKGCQVDAKPVGPGLIQAMDQEDHEEQYASALQKDEAQARINTEKRKNGETLAAGQRVQADDYGVELEYDHVGIHLFFDQRDQVMWYSEEPINFAVSVRPSLNSTLISSAPSTTWKLVRM